MYRQTLSAKLFFRQLLKKEKFSIKKAMSMYDSLFKEACSLGVFRKRDPMEGIEKDIKLAGVINSLK